MKRNKKVNYLDLVPVRNEDKYKWEQNEKGEVTIFIENRGVFHWLAQKLLKKPKISQVHLEEVGSFLWPLIDGSRTVFELGEQLKEKFGDQAEPLYPRLVTYIRNLEASEFIHMQ